MKSKKTSISIGIPVFNEQETIVSVVKSLLSQNRDSFILDRIIIVSDGSTDNTVSEIESNFGKSKTVKLIKSKKRLGKSARLLEIFSVNNSDKILIFDGDISIKDSRLVSKLIKQFKIKDVALVSGNTQPERPKSFFGRIWYANENLWYLTRKNYNNGNNLYNNSGQSIALTRDFAKRVFLPKNTIADQQFVYLSTIKENVKFKFVENAISYYIPPSTFRDIVLQIRRTINEGDFLGRHFGNDYDKYFFMPFRFKIIGLLRALRRDPYFTTLAILLFNLLRLLVKSEDPLTKKGIWAVAESTKKIISSKI